MNYTNFIYNLNQNVKKIKDENYQIQDDLKKSREYINLIPNFNRNSIGYKIKYFFEIDKEVRNNNYFNGLETILTYILETYIYNTEAAFLKYNFIIQDEKLGLYLFHNNPDYLENIGENLLNYISKELDIISSKIRTKFVDFSTFSLRTKIKLLQKEFPILIDILCNLVKEKRLQKNINEIIDSILKLLYTNDINILKDPESKLTILRSIEDPLTYLTQEFTEEENKRKSEEPPKKETKKFRDDVETKPITFMNPTEIINDNIKQLFWHSIDDKKTDKSDWIHGIIFLLVISVLVYTVPNFIQKFKDFSKSNSVIDNILDLATEDLTTTATKTFQNYQNLSNVNKLETIAEDAIEPYQPSEPVEPSEEDIGLITRNIIKKFNENENTNNELKNIENRLKLILEETETKT